MKRSIPMVLCLFVHFAHTQHTISGTFSPAEDYSWLIAYKLRPGAQVYVADTAINNGQFELHMPDSSETGSYRMVYGIPQETYFFDLLYNGKEDIKLDFKTGERPVFITSKENILFSTYFDEILAMERRMMAFYSNNPNDTNQFLAIIDDYSALHRSYLKRSENLIVHKFIEANNPYIPSRHMPLEEYVNNRKGHYFDALDITDPILQASGFVTDKIVNYIFTALPLGEIPRSEAEKAIRENFESVAPKLEGIEDEYKLHVYYSVWAGAASGAFDGMSDFIYSDYLKPLAESTDNRQLIEQIELHNRLRLGARAPELSWKEGANTKTLDDLGGFENIVLVFWSSTCSHCLNELPALHRELKKYPKTKVVAIGLEDDEANWKIESEKLDSFEHVMALGKWESTLAKRYDIQATPTYFILDPGQRIIAKPQNAKEVTRFLKN